MNRKSAKKTFEFHHNKHPTYTRILDRLSEEYIEKHRPDYLVVPYVLMCATTLEARLNDELYGFVHDTWGDAYKAIADSYLSMSFRAKLDAVVPILTNNKFRINQSHVVYKTLRSLISARNRAAHPRPTLGSFESDPLDPPFPSMPRYSIPEELIDFLDDLTMGLTKEHSPIEYHEAIEKLDRWVLRRCPDRLSKVALVIAVS